MKTVSLFAVLAISVCLIGCENAELKTCQQDKDLLQGQLDTANTTIGEKDGQIETLETKNTEIQTQAMQSIQTMLTKQAENDNKLKLKLVERAKQVNDLEIKVAALEAKIAEASDNDDDDDGDDGDDGDDDDDDEEDEDD